MKKVFALVLALCLALCCVSAMAEEDTYVIGICQLMQHPALDEATQGSVSYTHLTLPTT